MIWFSFLCSLRLHVDSYHYHPTIRCYCEQAVCNFYHGQACKYEKSLRPCLIVIFDSLWNLLLSFCATFGAAVNSRNAATHSLPFCILDDSYAAMCIVTEVCN